MLRDNWPVIDWREPIGLQERLEGRSSHNGEISVMSRDSSKGNFASIIIIVARSLRHYGYFQSFSQVQ